MKNYIFCILAFCGFLLSGCANKSDSSKEKTKVIAKAVAEKSNSAELTPSKSVSMLTVDTSITLDYLMGKFVPKKHKAFTIIEKKYASREGMYLRKETYNAFKEMFEAAKQDGVHLVIKSATRNFNSQKGIWEGKWTGKRKTEDGQDISKTIPDPKKRALKILEYSSMPGTSRHHWGTDIDINAFNNEYFKKGKGKKEYEWLMANAAKFGFCLPYTAKGKERPEGYNEERWHWSYLPLSKPLIDQAKLRLKNETIQGFLGAETAAQIQVVEKYVLGINKECL